MEPFPSPGAGRVGRAERSPIKFGNGPLVVCDDDFFAGRQLPDDFFLSLSCASSTVIVTDMHVPPSLLSG